MRAAYFGQERAASEKFDTRRTKDSEKRGSGILDAPVNFLPRDYDIFGDYGTGIHFLPGFPPSIIGLSLAERRRGCDKVRRQEEDRQEQEPPEEGNRNSQGSSLRLSRSFTSLRVERKLRRRGVKRKNVERKGADYLSLTLNA